MNLQLQFFRVQHTNSSVYSKEKAREWKLKWRGITRRLDIKAKPVRWLGFFIDCRFNWQAHVKHRLALGHYRIKATPRVMNANGVSRKLARKRSPCPQRRTVSKPSGRASGAPRRLQQADHSHRQNVGRHLRHCQRRGSVGEGEYLELWHYRLAHFGVDAVRKLRGMAEGILNAGRSAVWMQWQDASEAVHTQCRKQRVLETVTSNIFG